MNQIPAWVLFGCVVVLAALLVALGRLEWYVAVLGIVLGLATAALAQRRSSART